MKRAGFFAYLLAVIATLAVAVVAMGVDAPSASKTYLLMTGHTFGIGEQQVYAIDRSADLTIRYRDEIGELRSATYRHHLRSSAAFTIEGVSSAGRAVLAVATTNPAPQSSAYATAASAPAAPPPSPELDERGALTAQAGMADLLPASLILSSMSDEVLGAGKPWKSSGVVRLPYGQLSLNLDNAPAASNATDNNTVVQIHSTGSADVRGALAVKGFGRATLRGAGAADATAFVDAQNKLLLGLMLTSSSHGNVVARGKRGSYDLKVQVAIKLIHYVPGIPPVRYGPGYIIASGYLGSYSSPDTSNYSTAPPNPIAMPAATNTEYSGSPLPSYAPSALPEASLPPIPMPLASDQAIVSPPPGPSPTPTPTRY